MIIWPGNTNGDGQVDILDVGPLVHAWKSEPGMPNWDARCDFNSDGNVDAYDVSVIVWNWYAMP